MGGKAAIINCRNRHTKENGKCHRKKNITFSLSDVIFPRTYRKQQNIQAFHNLASVETAETQNFKEKFSQCQFL